MTLPAFPDCWPTSDQELLLEAALLDAPRASASWRRWRDRARLERLDAGSLALLPLVYSNLQGSKAEPEIEELKGAYVDTLARNEFQTRRAARPLAGLEASHVPTLILKGAALITRYYPDAGCRPMADVDVLVPRSRVRSAIEILERQGWRPASELSEDALLDWKGAALRHESGFAIDLHWAALDEAPGLDAELWAGAQHVAFGGVATRALNPADELLYGCIHGLKWRNPPSLRWIADATTIVREAAPDWTRLVRVAATHRLSLQASVALSYLRSRFDVPVPDAVADALEARGATRRERSLLRARSINPELRGPAAVWALHLELYRRRRRVGLVSRGPRGFVASVARTWDLDRPSEVVVETLRRGARRLRTLISGRKNARVARLP